MSLRGKLRELPNLNNSTLILVEVTGVKKIPASEHDNMFSFTFTTRAGVSNLNVSVTN